jgi:hypothetical protein
MTFKIIYLANRNPAIEPRDFPEAWRSHSRLASTRVNTMGQHYLRVCHCFKVYDADLPPAYLNGHDGVGLFTMHSWDSLVRARFHPDVNALQDDQPRVFAGYVTPWTMAAEEVRLIDKHEGSAALLHFLPRRPDVGQYEFQDKWSGEYADRIQNIEIVKKAACVFALNHVLDHPSPDYTFDGISELWFDDVEVARSLAWNREHLAVMNSLHTVADPARTVSLLVQLSFEKTKLAAGGGWSEKVPITI